MLAPNVYYLETPFAGRTARAKYAVVSLAAFERGTSRWFHSYLWGRFAQPCGLLYAADAAVRARVVGALGAAVATFATRTLPRLPSDVRRRDPVDAGPAPELCGGAPRGAAGTDPRALLRSGDRIRRADACRRLAPRLATRCVRSLSQRQHPDAIASRSACGWAVRRVQGKALSVARLLKASFTFDGGLPYLVWKIERHSGVKVEITPFMRRFPRWGAIGAMWRTWRRGGFR